jgi:hypothetical protein
MPEASLSLSNAIFVSSIAIIGIILYAGFAYLVAHSKHVEVRRRWRYSILWGVLCGAFLFILFGIGSVLALFGDEDTLGYMAAFRSVRGPLGLFKGILFFLAYPVLISLPFIFLITFVTYWKQSDMGDMFINQLLYPVKKHPSDQSSNSVFEQIRSFITKLID